MESSERPAKQVKKPVKLLTLKPQKNNEQKVSPGGRAESNDVFTNCQPQRPDLQGNLPGSHLNQGITGKSYRVKEMLWTPARQKIKG
jgi:hypothetical protein